MPHNMIFDAWNKFFPDRKPRVLQPLRPEAHSLVEIPRIRVQIGDIDYTESEDEALERFCKPLAECFVVSSIAMSIRLQKFKLLHRSLPRQRSFRFPPARDATKNQICIWNS